MPEKILPKDGFFQKMENLGLVLTYGDVRLRTGYSETLPDEARLESKFSRNIPLKIPVASAAMDTVTEHELAIELAKLGGIGVIHKNLTPGQQASQVAKVKYHLNGLIDKPICVSENETIENILQKRKEKGYSFHSFPVLDNKQRIIGILTKNDFDFCKDNSLPAKEVMTRKVITADAGTSMDQAYNIMLKQKKKALPLTTKDGKITGMYVFSDIKRIKSGDFTTYNTDKKGQLIVAAAIGVGDEAFIRLEKLIAKKVDAVVIDTAHADTKKVINTLKEIKKNYPSLDVVVGNISRPESAKRLLEAGADGIKVGQGPGSICTTRVIAGIGCPQVSAVYNCSKAIRGSAVPICADGGLRYSGDIPIAIGAGAHYVMMGSMLAGTKESPGDIVFLKGRQWKNYRGMGSIGAMKDYIGSRERYSQEKTGKSELIPEGVEGLTPYVGELKTVIFQYIGGLKRGMGYVGAADIEELRDKADFDRISAAGKEESHPHDIVITKEAPNYPLRQ